MGLVEEVAFNRLDRRIAKYLLKLDTEAVTHQTIASELGTVREIVSRILKSFQSEGLVRLSRNRVEIVQREKLQGFLAS